MSVFGVPVLDRRVGVCRGRFVVLLVVGVDGLPALLDAGVVLAVLLLLLLFLLSKAPAEAAAPPLPPCDALVSVLVVPLVTASVAVLEATGAEAAAATEAEDEDVPVEAGDSSLARRARSILSRWRLRSSSSSDELSGDLVGDLLA